MFCCDGCGFQATQSGIGYRNQRVWGENRVSFSTKMISWLKILDLDFLLGKLVIYCSQKNEIGKMYFNLTRSQFNSKESVDDFSYFWKIATLGQGEILGVWRLITGSTQTFLNIPTPGLRPINFISKHTLVQTLDGK